MSNQINQCWRQSVATQRKGSGLHGEAFHESGHIPFFCISMDGAMYL